MKLKGRRYNDCTADCCLPLCGGDEEHYLLRFDEEECAWFYPDFDTKDDKNACLNFGCCSLKCLRQLMEHRYITDEQRAGTARLLAGQPWAES